MSGALGNAMTVGKMAKRGSYLLKSDDEPQESPTPQDTKPEDKEGILAEIMGVLGGQNAALQRGGEDIAKDPEKMQNLLDMVAMMSAPVPGVGVATGLGADVFRSQHGGMGKISAGASALPVGIAVGKALGGAPVGSLMGLAGRIPAGLSTVQASADDIARAAERSAGKLSNIKQGAREASQLGALTSNMPAAAKLMQELKAIPEADNIARAKKVKEITGALFQGVPQGFSPMGGALTQALGRAQPGVSINKLVNP